MPQFELNRLVSYGEADIVSEIRRVAGLVRSEVLTRRAFDRHSKVSSSTVVRKLGSWESALARAGLAHRYAERTVTEKMRRQTTRTMTNHQLLQEMRRVAAERGGGILTAEEFNRRAAVNSETISRRFGSWKAGLASAGLEVANRGRRYSDEDYFENLLSVWTHYGRQPTYGQMDRAPSTIRAKAYEAKWGTWRKALLAFLERVNSPEQQPKASAEPPQQLRHEKAVASPPLHESPRRAVPLSLSGTAFWCEIGSGVSFVARVPPQTLDATFTSITSPRCALAVKRKLRTCGRCANDATSARAANWTK